MNPRRSAQGFTMVEILVVLLLTSLFGIVVAYSINSVTDAAQRETSRATAQSQARDVLEEVARTFRSARPVGACMDTGIPTSTPVATCRRIEDRPFTLAAASPTTLSFYAYATATSAPGANLRAPDLVQVSLLPSGSKSNLVLQRFAPKSNRDYTSLTFSSASLPDPSNWDMTRPTFSRLVGSLTGVPASGIFSYYNASGDPLAPASSPNPTDPVDPATLANTALVEVKVPFSAGVGRSAYSFDTDTFLSLPAASYRVTP